MAQYEHFPISCGETMRKFTIMTICALLLSLLLASNLPAKQRGIKVVIKDTSGREVGLYKESHALLIGVSNYIAGWPKLERVPYEIEQVEAVLKKKGFHVVKVMDPTSVALSEVFEDFINKYGFDENNRLLFFFSGHGHTRKRGKKGYLVPIDAPDPRYDDKGFVRKAIGMGQILTWSREIEAKHVLFLFDSCFSGTVFKVKALPKIPPHISDVTSRPVRQFISAGSAGEEVPASSVFTPLFIRAVRGEGDLDRDGYITGTELGMYLHKKVLSYNTGQHPQYGKIKDPDLDEGDFVFALKSDSRTPSHIPESVLNPPEVTSLKDQFEILREGKTAKQKWGLWQQKMKGELQEAINAINTLELNAQEVFDLLTIFVSTYKADNPYSTKDNEIRNKIKTYLEKGVSGVQKSMDLRSADSSAIMDAKNAYTAGQAYFADYPDRTVTKNKLIDYGLRPTEGVTLTIESGTYDTLRIRASHVNGSKVYFIDEKGAVVTKLK